MLAVIAQYEEEVVKWGTAAEVVLRAFQPGQSSVVIAAFTTVIGFVTLRVANRMRAIRRLWAHAAIGVRQRHFIVLTLILRP